MAQRIEEKGTAGPRAVAPQFFTRDDGQSMPFLDAGSPFILAHHPARYMVLGGKLVPSPSKVVLADGVGRVRIARDGRVQFADAQASLIDRGMKLIPYEWGPDGESYLIEVDTRPGGRANTAKAYVTCWESVHPGENNTTPNETAYAEWLEQLVRDGRLPSCPPHIARRMLDQAQASLRDAEERREAGKLRDLGRLDELRAQVKVLEAAARPAAPVKGKPKKAVDLDGGDAA